MVDRRKFLQVAATSAGAAVVSATGLMGCSSFGSLGSPTGGGVSPTTSRRRNEEMLAAVASVGGPKVGGQLLESNSSFAGATAPPPPLEVLATMYERYRRQTVTLWTPVITQLTPDTRERYLQLDESGENALIGSPLGAFYVRRSWAEWLFTRDTCLLVPTANTDDGKPCSHWSGKSCDVLVSRQEFQKGRAGEKFALYATINPGAHSRSTLARHQEHLPEFSNCVVEAPCEGDSASPGKRTTDT